MRIAKGARRQGPFAPIEEAIEAIREGRMVIVVDDEDRENEGDLTIAAEKVTPEAINFMARHGRGLVCMPMTGERLDQLEVPLMVNQNTTTFNTAFCVSIEGKQHVSTGISAADRAATVRAAIDPKTRPSDLARPGHMFPLRARDGGVLVRAGQTEAAVDLARIAGLYPAGVICEIMNEDGTMARVPELTKFAKKHGLLMITIADLIKYRMRTERLVKRVATAELPTEHGAFRIYAYENQLDNETHIALVRGEIALVANPKSNIYKVQDLAGKKAGYTNPKSTSELLLRLALKESGMAGKVEPVSTGGFGGGLTALDTGGIDAAPLIDPILTLQPNRYRVIFSFADLIPRMTWLVGIAKRDFAAAYVKDERFIAVVTVGRDHLSLEAEAAFERQDSAALARIFFEA